MQKLVELDADSSHPPHQLLLAMTYWQLGDKETARHHYDEAVRFIEQDHIDDQITLGFRSEAAELLGIDADARQPAE
ncbi:MAG: hypothetical protein R3C10_23955 [Pirellulales bacterium]